MVALVLRDTIGLVGATSDRIAITCVLDQLVRGAFAVPLPAVVTAACGGGYFATQVPADAIVTRALVTEAGSGTVCPRVSVPGDVVLGDLDRLLEMGACMEAGAIPVLAGEGELHLGLVITFLLAVTLLTAHGDIGTRRRRPTTICARMEADVPLTGDVIRNKVGTGHGYVIDEVMATNEEPYAGRGVQAAGEYLLLAVIYPAGREFECVTIGHARATAVGDLGTDTVETTFLRAEGGLVDREASAVGHVRAAVAGDRAVHSGAGLGDGPVRVVDVVGHLVRDVLPHSATAFLLVIIAVAVPFPAMGKAFVVGDTVGTVGAACTVVAIA